MRQTEIALANTHQPRFGPDRVQKTFSPQGSGQVPTIVPSLLSGVAPATPPPESVPPAASSPPQSGNGPSSQGG